MADGDEKKRDEEEVGLYEKLASRTVEIMENSKKTLDEALKKAKDDIHNAGDTSRVQVDKLASFLRRDLSGLKKTPRGVRGPLKGRSMPKGFPWECRASLYSFSAVLQKSSRMLRRGPKRAWSSKPEKSPAPALCPARNVVPECI